MAQLTSTELPAHPGLDGSLVVKFPLLRVCMTLLHEYAPFPMIKASGLPRIKVYMFEQLVMGEFISKWCWVIVAVIHSKSTQD